VGLTRWWFRSRQPLSGMRSIVVDFQIGIPLFLCLREEREKKIAFLSTGLILCPLSSSKCPGVETPTCGLDAPWKMGLLSAVMIARLMLAPSTGLTMQFNATQLNPRCL
jgi:hypothetical protein